MSPSTSGRRRQSSGLRGLVELIVTVAIAVAIAYGVQAILIKPYKIPSGSMIPTLHIGQRILVSRLSRHPHVGEVVVFHPPAGANQETGPQCGNTGQGPGHASPCDTPTPQESNQTFVKRVVGVGGDHLMIRNGHVYRNGVQEKGSYIQPCLDPSVCTYRQTIVVPKGDYYMMGDNRGDSDDSRFWGPIPQKWVIGVAFFTYWPLDRIGTL